MTEQFWSWADARADTALVLDQLTPEQALAVLCRLVEEPNEQYIAPMLSGLVQGYAAGNRDAAGTCAVCGIPVQQPMKGRRRKYCEGCVERLGHRTPSTQARKNGAEKATRPSDDVLPLNGEQPCD